jgi:hypothetical protein
MPRKRYSFWIDDEQADGLKVVKERDGVLESEQIRRANQRGPPRVLGARPA